eukprot:4877441-Ditylum_brightwellii.AAC.1
MECLSQDYKLEFEVAGIGPGIGQGGIITRELKVSKSKEGWTKAVEEEHQWMVDNAVWRPVMLEDVP